ncbi:MAG: preprotein translocase subunit SecE [Mariniblastus sp.]|nr:preprotein translocase subunit SecE [Mariniblastus sp.]
MSSMAKQKQVSQGSFWSELFRLGLYKPNQGRIVRQVTFVAIVVLMCLAAFEIGKVSFLRDLFVGSKYLIPFLIGIVGLWLGYRVVNYTRFADFLIAVEAEMNKVSWPGKTELWSASCVVIFVIFAMALALFAFDVIWTKIFEVIGIRYTG